VVEQIRGHGVGSANSNRRHELDVEMGGRLSLLIPACAGHSPALWRITRFHMRV